MNRSQELPNKDEDMICIEKHILNTTDLKYRHDVCVCSQNLHTHQNYNTPANERAQISPVWRQMHSGNTEVVCRRSTELAHIKTQDMTGQQQVRDTGQFNRINGSGQEGK